MAEEDEKPGTVAVAVVVADEPVDAEPERDTSEDDAFDKFVVCIVRTPKLIIGITLSISFLVAAITISAILATGGSTFATSRIGNEDRGDVRSLNYDAVKEAKSGLWPVIVDPCDTGRKRGGFRRLEEEGAGKPTGGVFRDVVAPIVTQTMGALKLGATAATFHTEYGTPPPDRPPLGPIPRWDAENMEFVWDAKSATRRLQDAVVCPGDEVETVDDSITWDYSGCDPFAAPAPKSIDNTTGVPFGTGATGVGCNKVCDPDTDRECTGQQTENKDFMVFAFESVSGANTYYGSAAMEDENKDPYEAGPGNSFSHENMMEVKRLEDLVLKATDYERFCKINAGPDGKGACAGMSSVLNFFHPRISPPTADLISEVQNRPNPMDPTSILSTDLGCHLQWFMFELYEGPSTEMFQVMGILGVALTPPPPPGAGGGWGGGGGNGAAAAADAMAMAMAGATALVTALLDTGFENVYAGSFCDNTIINAFNALQGRPSLPAPSEGSCNAVPGCKWSSGSCVLDAERTETSKTFADVMCFGDGSGEMLTATTTPSSGKRAADLANFHAAPHLRPFLDFYFDLGFSPANPTTKYSRAFMQFGTPMAGFTDMQAKSFIDGRQTTATEYGPFKNSEDGNDERSGSNHQSQAFVEWFMNGPLDEETGTTVSVRNNLQEKSAAEDPQTVTGGQVEVTYLLSALLFDEIFALIIGDMLLAVISFVVVGFYMWFQTGSFWIAMFGMAEITISLPMSYFVYTYIFRIEYFDFMCSLSIYIVMAIGADDVFIWFDAYKQSKYEPEHISNSLETRFIWAWRKAASAMLVTSLTTCVAFLATATSPLMSIKSFGLFTAVVIFLDYIYVITWLPAATVLYNKWFENTGFCRCNCCCQPQDPDAPPKSLAVAAGTGAAVALPIALMFSGYFFWLGGQDVIYAKAYGIGLLLFFILFVGMTLRIATTVRRSEEGRAAVEFFEGPFSDFITTEKVRYALLGVSALILIPCAIAALYITPATKDEQILPADHPLQKVITIMNNEFPVSGRDEKVRSEIAFGITGYDRKGASPLWDYRRDKAEEAELAASGDQPEVIFDATFDWTSPVTQRYLKSTCVALDNSGFVKGDRKPDCNQEPCEQLMTACVVEELAKWLNTTVEDCTDQEGCKSAHMSVPDDDTRTGSFISNYNLPNGLQFDRNCFGAGRTDTCLPTAMANRILWDFYNEAWKSTINQGVGFTDSTDPDSKVKYVILQFSLDMKRRAYYTYDEAYKIYEAVDDFTAALTPPASAGAVPVHTTTVGKWKFMHTQHIYVTYALGGIACAIGLAYLVLMVATNNIIASSIAIFTIIAVCICVLGAMVFAGWELGNIESICLTILAGFCVDYIVHLAHCYMESPDSSSREARVRYSVGHMGVSVLSGALTSLGASLLLFFCTLQFFSSFGTFFFGTIFLAWLWANFFFVPALGTLGPAGTQGDLIGGICGGGGGGGDEEKKPVDNDKADTIENPAAAED